MQVKFSFLLLLTLTMLLPIHKVYHQAFLVEKQLETLLLKAPSTGYERVLTSET